MGGVPPLGYRARDHKLIVIDSEAEIVRHIFRRYAALGSVRLLKEELDAHGMRSKRWASAAGRRWGGKPLARGALYLMLQNRIYRGEIVTRTSIIPASTRRSSMRSCGTTCRLSSQPTRSSTPPAGGRRAAACWPACYMTAMAIA